MFKEQSQTPVGKDIERNITFAVRDLKAVSDRINFIRRGVVALGDIGDDEAGMECLRLVENNLDDLILDIKDNIEKVIALDALAAGGAPFIPQSRHEKEAIAALKRAQDKDFDLSLSHVLCRAVILAEKAFAERCKRILVGDDDVAAVVEGVDIEAVSAGQTPGETL